MPCNAPPNASRSERPTPIERVKLSISLVDLANFRPAPVSAVSVPILAAVCNTDDLTEPIDDSMCLVPWSKPDVSHPIPTRNEVNTDDMRDAPIKFYSSLNDMARTSTSKVARIGHIVTMNRGVTCATGLYH